MSEPREAAAPRAQAVLRRIRAIPEGYVRTYGDVSPGAPRYAGTVLSRSEDPELPWWRVVRADGTLVKGARQRALLEAEGVPFRGDRDGGPGGGGAGGASPRVDMRVARIPEGALPSPA